MSISVRDVWFRYEGNEKWIIRGVTADFISGKNLILGRNGSGKTTLLRIILGYYRPHKGYVEWNGKKIRSYKDLLGHVIYVPVNVKLFLTGPKVRDEIGEFLPELADKRVFHLSEGEARIVAIASALRSNREVIVIDEPTIGLDKIMRKRVIDLIKNVDDKIIIITTNDLRIVENFDQIFLLAEGKLENVNKEKLWLELNKVFGQLGIMQLMDELKPNKYTIAGLREKLEELRC